MCFFWGFYFLFKNRPQIVYKKCNHLSISKIVCTSLNNLSKKLQMQFQVNLTKIERVAMFVNLKNIVSRKTRLIIVQEHQESSPTWHLSCWDFSSVDILWYNVAYISVRMFSNESVLQFSSQLSSTTKIFNFFLQIAQSCQAPLFLHFRYDLHHSIFRVNRAILRIRRCILFFS